MQEYVEERTIAISIKAAKLSGRALAAACKKVLAEMKKHHEAAKRPHGRQSVKKLMNHYGTKSAMKYVGAPKDFDRIAKGVPCGLRLLQDQLRPLSAVLQGRSGGRYHSGLLQIHGKSHGPQSGKSRLSSASSGSSWNRLRQGPSRRNGPERRMKEER